MDTKGKVVRFPLGSSTDVNDGDMSTLEEVVRQGMTDLIVVGLDSEGELTVVYDPGLAPERVYFLLSKAMQRAAAEPIDMEFEDDEDDEDVDEEDDEREDQS
jgi:hypothetical protein